MNRCRYFPTYFVMFLVGLTPLNALALSYSIVDLGMPNAFWHSTVIYAVGVNDSGEVVGFASTNAGEDNAFSYSNGVMTDLGTLPGSAFSEAVAINSSGHTVGDSDGHAFLYSGGTMTDLGTLPNDTSSIATDVNDAGQVVGNGLEHAFLYSGGRMVDLNALLPANSGWTLTSAAAINDNGSIVGYGTNPSDHSDAFVYSNGVVTDLGTLGSPYNGQSGASAINNAGEIVGWAESEGLQGQWPHAFLYRNGNMIDLGAPLGDFSSANAINSSGQIVGQTGDAGGERVAFLYTNGEMTDLNSLIPATSGWDLTDARDINDNGWIVGNGTNPEGEEDAYLLIPAPEPTQLATLAIGVGLALARRRNLTTPIATH